MPCTKAGAAPPVDMVGGGLTPLPDRSSPVPGAGDVETVYTNVLEFGALPDGVSDSSDNIQRAIDFLADSLVSPWNRGVVFLPAGTYRIARNIRLKSNITLVGEGVDATILRAMTLASPQPISISQLTAGGSTTGATSYTTASYSPPAQTVILVVVQSRRVVASVPAIPTLSGNGITWVQVATATVGTDRLTLFRGVSSGPSTGAITIDFGGQSQTRVAWKVLQATDADATSGGANAIVQSVVGAEISPPAPRSLTLAAFATTANGTLGLFANSAATSILGAAEAGYTEIAETTVGGLSQFIALGCEWRPDNDTSVTWTWDSAPTIALEIACEIKASAAAAATVMITANSGVITNAGLKDLTIDCNDLASVGIAGRGANYFNDFTLENVHVDNALDDGIQVHDGTTATADWFIKDVEVFSSAAAGIRLVGTGHKLVGVTTTGNTIGLEIEAADNCHIEVQTEEVTGIDVVGDLQASTIHHVAQGCTTAAADIDKMHGCHYFVTIPSVVGTNGVIVTSAAAGDMVSNVIHLVAHGGATFSGAPINLSTAAANHLNNVYLVMHSGTTFGSALFTGTKGTNERVVDVRVLPPSQSATFVVAASDANAKVRAAADYVCDGTADEVEINAAITALPTTGGGVVLSEGTFTIAAPVLIQDKCVHLQGAGLGWAHADSVGTPVHGATIITAAAAYNNDFITIRTSTGTTPQIYQVAGTTISDLKIFQNFSTTSPNAHGIHSLGNISVDRANNIWVYNVSVSGVGGIGLYLQGGENWVNLVTIRATYNEGLHANGGDNVIANITLGGCGRGTKDGVLIGGATTICNVYVYGSGRYGIHIESPATGRVQLSNFFVETSKRVGLIVSGGNNAKQVAISNGTCSYNGVDGTLGPDSRVGMILVGSDIVVSDVLCLGNSNQQYGIIINDVSRRISLSNVLVRDHQQSGVLLQGAQDITFQNCYFANNGQALTNTHDDIRLQILGAANCSRIKVIGCTFLASAANVVRYGISEQDANQDNNEYYFNTFDGSQGTGPIQEQGASTLVFRRLAGGLLGTPDNLNIGGYSRIGAVAVPTNITAGDITAIRLVLPDHAIPADPGAQQLSIASAMTPPATGVRAAGAVGFTITPDVSFSQARAISANLIAQPSANIVSGTGFGLYMEAKQNAGAFNMERLVGSFQQVQKTVGGTLSEALGLWTQLDLKAGTTTLGIGADIRRAVDAGATATTLTGLRIGAVGGTGGTVGTDIAIQSLGGQHRFVGALALGVNATPTAGYILDARGAARIEKAAGEMLSAFITGEANAKLRLQDDRIELGPGGAGALDSDLRRIGANVLQLTDVLQLPDRASNPGGTASALRLFVKALQTQSTLYVQLEGGTLVPLSIPWRDGFLGQGGFTSTVTGSGGTAAVPRTLRVNTGATATSTASLATSASSAWTGQGSADNVVQWGRWFAMRFTLSVLVGSTNSVVRVTIGKASGATANPAVKSIGIRVDNLALKGLAHNGTTLTVVDLTTTLTSDTVYEIIIVGDGAGNVEWFLDGVSKGTTALGPTGNGTAGNSMWVYEVDNGGDAVNTTTRLYEFDVAHIP